MYWLGKLQICYSILQDVQFCDECLFSPTCPSRLVLHLFEFAASIPANVALSPFTNRSSEIFSIGFGWDICEYCNSLGLTAIFTVRNPKILFQTVGKESKKTIAPPAFLLHDDITFRTDKIPAQDRQIAISCIFCSFYVEQTVIKGRIRSLLDTLL